MEGLWSQLKTVTRLAKEAAPHVHVLSCHAVMACVVMSCYHGIGFRIVRDVNGNNMVTSVIQRDPGCWGCRGYGPNCAKKQDHTATVHSHIGHCCCHQLALLWRRAWNPLLPWRVCVISYYRVKRLAFYFFAGLFYCGLLCLLNVCSLLGKFLLGWHPIVGWQEIA